MTWQPDYASVAEVRAFLRIDDAVDDVEIQLAVTTASRAIDQACNRQFGLIAAAEVRYLTAHFDAGRSLWAVEMDDLMTLPAVGAVTCVDVDGTLIGTVDAYSLLPRNAAAIGRPWTELLVKADSACQPTGIEDEVSILARWGWTTVPAPITQACLLQTSRLLARRDSPYGVAGSPDTGSELRLLARLDPDVIVALGPYRRWWAAA